MVMMFVLYLLVCRAGEEFQELLAVRDYDPTIRYE